MLSTRTYRCFLFGMALLFSVTGMAQRKIISGTVRDINSEEPVSFASVRFKNTNTGRLTDSAGRFFMDLSSWPSDTLEITCVGYQPYRTWINTNKESVELIINMERGTFNEGANVKVKVNKGLLVWRKIVQHKPENDPWRFKNFGYELDNKLELDLKHINFEKFGKFKPLRSISNLINQNLDTAEGLKYLPAYLTEVISDYYVQKDPKKRREVQKASYISGKIKNESVIKMLGGTGQVVNVYNNFIPVTDKQFISPISDNGDNYYNYRVVDTQMISNSRYYHLVFTPKRKGSDTFEGDCWVQVGSFAIWKMNLRLGKDANINFVENLSLIEEFKMINDSTWFLFKDKFVLDVSPLGKNSAGFIGRKTSTYANVKVNDSTVAGELAKNIELEEVILLPDALTKPKEFWDTARHEPLTRTEAGILRMIDTLTNAPVFKKFTKTITFLGTGYLDIGKFQIGPWFNWVTTNSWEGLRVRFDLGTNKHFNKKVRFHGYLAYGFKDDKVKGMFETFYLPNKHPRTYLYGSYTNDMEFGQNYYGDISSDNIFALAIRKKNVPVKKVQAKETRLEFFRENTSWMSNRLAITYKTTIPRRNLLPADSFPVKGSGQAFTNFEVALRFHIAYLERFVESHFYRSSLGSPYPIGELNISHGFSGVVNSSYDYTKISASISDYNKIPPFGNIYWRIYGGKTFGTLPYFLLDIAPGNELYYYNPYAFNMMNRWEFVHDKYAGVNFEHNFGSGLFRLVPKLRFRQFWTAKVLWGSLSSANKALNFKQGNNFRTLDGKPYVELGTGIDNIIRVFRIDFIWRFLSPSLQLPSDKKFGVFGSVKFSF